jgi:hypothetical protein
MKVRGIGGTMQVIIASTRTQGERPGDFSFTTVGEPVYLGFICDRDRRDPDGGCGCGRSFSGLDSHLAGTTAEVVDLPLTRTAYRDRLAASLHAAGWEPIAAPLVEGMADELLEIAAAHPVGTVLGRRGEEILPR